MGKIKEVLCLRFELGLGNGRSQELGRSVRERCIAIRRKQQLQRFARRSRKAWTGGELNKHRSEANAPTNDPANEPFPTLPLCTSSCSSIVISRGSWSGKSTGRRVRKDTATAASASCISAGATNRMS